jgi:tRNA G10  N-methylase Trm11
VAKLFFLLSGEHETLPTSELRVILEAEGYAFREAEKLDQVLRLEAELHSVEAIKRRSAYTRICASELFNCEAETSKIADAMRSISLDKVLENEESFAVRVKHVKNYGSKIDGMALEGELGKFVLSERTNVKVNLKNPDKTFLGVLTNERFIFGLKLAEILPKPFVERRPRRKPFFHRHRAFLQHRARQPAFTFFRHLLF